MDDDFLFVWSELCAAYYSQAALGDAAEVYSFYLMNYRPSMKHEGLREQTFLEAGAKAHRKMVELCTAFERVMQCKLLFNSDRHKRSPQAIDAR